ncbi:MAG: neutral/alkaline non-lysosomal ceramidase N-terminal domain-containing protein [Algicola sp.]|nr:neutral/alkaline non-lysosomal ceramidase N-terminal domain-containing protein [Algicola sp.]
MSRLLSFIRYLSMVSVLLASSAAFAGKWNIGSGIYDVTGPAGRAKLLGYANGNYVKGIQTRLWSRAYVIEDPKSKKRIVFVSADIHNMPQGVKQGVIKKLKRAYGELYDKTNVMLTATHTHIGPGGYDHHIMLNAGSGYDERHYNAIVNGIFQSIVKATKTLVPGDIFINKGQLTDASISRNEIPYDRNPDAGQYAAKVNQNMTLLKFVSDKGVELGSVNWFAVHNTSLGLDQRQISGDNKGMASQLFEKTKGSNYQKDQTFVAAFANSNLGDSTPNICGARNGCRNTESASALLSATKQFSKAQELYNNAQTVLSGDLDYRHQINYLPGYQVNEKFAAGNRAAKVCEGVFGWSFIAGSTHDGFAGTFGAVEGMSLEDPNLQLPSFITTFMDAFPGLKKYATDQMTDECQWPKPGFINRHSKKGDLYTAHIPFQIFTIGELAIVSVAGEMTTMSGRRLENQLSATLKSIGIKEVVIAGLANAYHGYITTPEEYNAQHYEGAHTIFGPNTLPAYLQIYNDMANALVNNSSVNAGPTAPDLSNSQMIFNPLLLLDGKPVYENFGQVHQDANPHYLVNDEVTVKYRSAKPKNNYLTQSSFIIVQRWVNGQWVDFKYDNDISTTFVWYSDPNLACLYCSFAEAKWTPDQDTPSGYYRIMHQGYWKDFAFANQYFVGYSSKFFVANVKHKIALKGVHNLYLSADQNGGGTVNANSNHIDDWEQFGMIHFEENIANYQTGSCIKDGSVVGLLTGSNKYLTVPLAGTLDADASHYMEWERFTLINHSNSTGCWSNGDQISLQSFHGGYVTADQNGTAMANSSIVGSWERFNSVELVEKVKHNVSIYNPTHGSYLSANDNGGGDVIAKNMAFPQVWEKFDLLVLAPINLSSCIKHGSRISLRTGRGHFLSARANGGFNAQGSRMQTWERFTVIKHVNPTHCINSGDSISLLGTHNRYVSANSNGEVHANQTHTQAWEMFEVIIH